MLKHTQHSLLFSNESKNNPYRLLSDVLYLPFNMAQIFDINWLREYEINDIAATLVHRLHRKDDTSSTLANNNIELRLCFPGNIISSLQQSNEFLNAHQTGTSCGYGGKDRAIIEALFLKMQFDMLNNLTQQMDYQDNPQLHFLRPKYALCHDKNNMLGNMTSLQYGNFTAVLYDHIKYRATYTLHDSMTPFIDNPTYTFHTNSKTCPYEAQIYGHVCIINDVKHFLVNPAALLFEKNAIEELKKFNKPIFNSVTGKSIFTPLVQTAQSYNPV